jgi:DmsE family decaheme c-type cytochrome
MQVKLLILISIGVLILLKISFPGQTKNENHEVNWVLLNPAFEGATFVNDTKECLSCHDVDGLGEKYNETVHAHMFNSPRNRLEAVNCESCHGPRSQHIIDFDDSLTLTSEAYNAVCMQCHKGGERMHWHSSLHKTAEVGCTSCHTVMEKRSQTGLLSATNETQLCAGCYNDVVSKSKRNFRHPVLEGKMECSSCHNVHGSPGKGMLQKANANETCYSCHQEKRGPFMWEHSPVREDCMTCHDPHGSNNMSMLVTQSASLCVSCHQYGGHINQYRYNRVSTPYGNGCVNCHVTVHGSNHPSGVKFNR